MNPYFAAASIGSTPDVRFRPAGREWTYRKEDKVRVQEIMTSDVLTIGPEAEIRDVARIFLEHGISGLPVCGAQREILGVVSEGDILFKEQGPTRGQSVLSRFGGKALQRSSRRHLRSR